MQKAIFPKKDINPNTTRVFKLLLQQQSILLSIKLFCWEIMFAESTEAFVELPKCNGKPLKVS